MSVEEKTISFYNNYFVFIKISDPEITVEFEGNITQAVDKDEPLDLDIKPQSTLQTTDIPTTAVKKVTKKKKKIKLVKKNN